MPKAEFGAAHSRKKRQAHFIRACRLSYQLYILSNRIVKPNNRYTRQPASHDFLFYSVPDKVYVLTATNRIAMRFAVRSAPPFRYPADSSDNAKGGTVSGTATLDHAFLPAVRRCKTEHLNDGGSNVCQTVLGGNAGSVLCIVLDSVLDFLIIDDERNGVE